MDKKTKEQINDNNGWVICGVRQSLQDIGKMMPCLNKSAYNKIQRASKKVEQAIKLLEEANEEAINEVA